MVNPIFKVHSPARSLDGQLDPVPVYVGEPGSTVNVGVVTFGAAVVTPGTRVPGGWQACSYFRPPFVLPGVGLIEGG